MAEWEQQHPENGHKDDKDSCQLKAKSNVSVEDDYCFDEIDAEDPLSLLPKDKGWGWMCVLGCFGVNALVVGAAAKSFGVLFLEFVHKFNSTKAAASWITALDQCLALLLGPVANMLSERFSSRWVIFTGGLFMCCGLILSIFATSLEYLYFSYGTLVGIGSALAYAPSIVTVGQYFEKRRALANGISVSGSGVGNFAIPPLMRVLLDYYGLSGALLVLAAIMLNVCVCGLLMRPPSFYKHRKRRKYLYAKTTTVLDTTGNDTCTDESREISKNIGTATKEMTDTHDGALAYESIPSSDLIHVNGNTVAATEEDLITDRRHNSQISRKSCNSQASSNAQETYTRKRLKSLGSRSCNSDIVCASFQSVPFVEQQQKGANSNINNIDHVENFDSDSEPCLFCLGCRNTGKINTCCCCNQQRQKNNKKKKSTFDFTLLKNPVFLCFACSVFLAFSGYPNLFIIVPAHAVQVGLSKTQSALLISLIGITDLIGRILFGWFFDLGYVRKLWGFMLSMVLSGLFCLGVQWYSDFVTLALFSSVVGFFAGAFSALIAPILADSFGVEKLPSAFGLTVMFMGSSFLYAPSLVGYLADVTGTWHASFYFCGAVMIASSLVLFLVPVAKRTQKS